MIGRTYQVKRRQRKRKEKKKKKGTKERRKVKSTKQKERKREGRGRRINRKENKEKRVGVKYLDKRKYCVGTEPSACILVTSTTAGPGCSVVSALASQGKGSLSPDPPRYARVWHCQTRSDANTLTT